MTLRDAGAWQEHSRLKISAGTRALLAPRCTTGKVLPAAAAIIAAIFVSNQLAAQQKNAENNPEIRSCTQRDKGSTKNSAKRKKSSTDATDRSANDACLEIRLRSLAVQERLQAFIRDQQWRVGDKEISDSIWMFSRELYREELLAWAKPDPATEKVNWARGRAALQVQTIDLEDGFTRVIVSAYFEGFGEPEDKFAMQRASWKLISTGKPLRHRLTLQAVRRINQIGESERYFSLLI